MKFQLETRINDGKAEMPPSYVNTEEFDVLIAAIEDDLVNDEGKLFGPGFTFTLTRLE